eukprot:10501271-Alexandrium_andersonii.AAC.1
MTVRSPLKEKRSAVRAGGIIMPAKRKRAQWPRCGAKLAAKAAEEPEGGGKEKRQQPNEAGGRGERSRHRSAVNKGVCGADAHSSASKRQEEEAQPARYALSGQLHP